MTFQVPVKTDKPSGASIHPIRLRATRVPSLPVSVMRGLLISIDSPCRMIVRCVQQQKATVPVSGLRAPDVSGVSTNPAPGSVTWMATRCFAVAEPADATEVTVIAAAARAATAVSFVLIAPPRVDDNVLGKRGRQR